MELILSSDLNSLLSAGGICLWMLVVMRFVREKLNVERKSWRNECIVVPQVFQDVFEIFGEI